MEVEHNRRATKEKKAQHKATAQKHAQIQNLAKTRHQTKYRS